MYACVDMELSIHLQKRHRLVTKRTGPAYVFMYITMHTYRCNIIDILAEATLPCSEALCACVYVHACVCFTHISAEDAAFQEADGAYIRLYRCVCVYTCICIRICHAVDSLAEDTLPCNETHYVCIRICVYKCAYICTWQSQFA